MKMELAPSPAEELREAWDNVMFNQFHDILCGCTVKSAAEDALEMFAQSRAVGSKLLYKTLGRICKQIDTQIDGVTGAGKENWQIWEEEDNGVPVVLFNLIPIQYIVFSRSMPSLPRSAMKKETVAPSICIRRLGEWGG